MIYEPNRTAWKRGDIVIHDADAKRPEMLMRVTGATTEGRLITRYIDQRVSADRFENIPDVLHDPARFGITPPNARAVAQTTAPQE